MKYFATKLTAGDVTVAGVKFKKGIEMDIDNSLYCYLNADKKNFSTRQGRAEYIANKAAAATGKGGPIGKADLGTAIKPDKNK